MPNSLSALSMPTSTAPQRPPPPSTYAVFTIGFCGPGLAYIAAYRAIDVVATVGSPYRRHVQHFLGLSERAESQPGNIADWLRIGETGATSKHVGT